MSGFAAWAGALRPWHWTKNVPVAAGLVFGQRLHDPEAVAATLVCFAAFCLVSSAGYLVNDVVDREEDRRHPARNSRPIASGAIRPGEALLAAAVLGGGGLAAGFALLPVAASLFLAGYAATTTSYTLVARRVLGLAPVLVAGGFVLRVWGGAAAARVVPSPWLLVLTALLALTLSVAKRESEEREAKGEANRRLRLATDSMLLASAAGYGAWTVWPTTVALHRTGWLDVTALPVVLALLRFRTLLRRETSGRGPADLLARDPLLLSFAGLWVASVLVVLALAG